MSEPHPRRRALAERLGATVVEPDALVAPASPGDVVDDPFDVALECSGHAVAMEAALAQLKRGGTLVFVGAGMKPPRLDANRILLNELLVTGAFVYDADGFDRALELLTRPDFPTDVLIEHDDVSLDGLYDALVGLHDGRARREGHDRSQPRGGPMTSATTRKPRFNHVAMSLPSELLDAEHRKEIVSFYEDVFGWNEQPVMTLDGQRLVLSAYTYEQFVFLIADDSPMACPRLDHFGISVATEDELDDMLARARRYQEHDDRVDIVDKKVDDHGMLAITSFYVRYLLPDDGRGAVVGLQGAHQTRCLTPPS